MDLFFFKQKTAYEMRISDWSSDVCSSDLATATPGRIRQLTLAETCCGNALGAWPPLIMVVTQVVRSMPFQLGLMSHRRCAAASSAGSASTARMSAARSEEHTSELQSLMRISYAVFCLKKKKNKKQKLRQRANNKAQEYNPDTTSNN